MLEHVRMCFLCFVQYAVSCSACDFGRDQEELSTMYSLSVPQVTAALGKPSVYCHVLI